MFSSPCKSKVEKERLCKEKEKRIVECFLSFEEKEKRKKKKLVG